MSRVVTTAIVLGTALTAGAVVSPPLPAATSIVAQATAESAVELVVIEDDNCVYCTVFRSSILPSYQSSPRAKSAPMRFLNWTDEATGKLSLKAPLTTLPTVVILRDHKELDRIPGLVAPDDFFHILDQVLSRTD